MGKQHIHTVAIVAVRQTKHFAQVVLAVGGRSLEMHHIALDSSAALFCEDHLASLLRIKFLGPRCLKVNGIEQIHSGIGLELVRCKDSGNHAVGMGFAPVVDDLQISAIGKVKRIYLGIVIFLHVGLILWDEADALCRVDFDAVGDVDGHRRVNKGDDVHHFLEIVVDFFKRTIQSKYVSDLLACLAVSPLVEHSQQVAHTDGRQNDAFFAPLLFIDGAEQVAGKIIDVVTHLALGFGQFDVPDGISVVLTLLGLGLGWGDVLFHRLLSSLNKVAVVAAESQESGQKHHDSHCV